MKFRAVLLAGLLVASCAQAADTKDITIRRADGQDVTFTVETATNDTTRAKGLMFREHLGDHHGMLFVYDRPDRISFWMKNTLIPLDMVFFREDGEIVHIERKAEPKSLTPRGPGRTDICAVLEIAGGQADENGLKIGDRLVLEDSSACLP